MAVALCTAILLLAVYVQPLAAVLRIVSPDLAGWTLIIAASMAPLLVGIMVGAFRAGMRGGSHG
jgi:Ca2+-transporting ATPase